MTQELTARLHDAYRRDFEAAKELVARAADEKRELSAEEESQYAKLSDAMNSKLAKIDDLGKNEERAAKLGAIADRLEVTASAPINNDGDLLRAVLAGEKNRATFEMRALATATATTPVTFADFVVEALVTGNAIYEGATKVRTADARNITVPVMAGTAPAAAFVSQGGTITAADPVFTSVTLGANALATLTLASNDLIRSAGFNLVEYIGRSAGNQIAYTAGSACALGTGTVQPNGFVTALTTAGALSTATGSAFWNASDLITAVYALGVAYRRPATAWHMSTSAISKARKLTDTNGQFLLQPSLAAGQPETLLGFRVKENVAMAAVGSASKSVVLIHEPSYYIREVGSVDVATSSDRYFEINSTGVRAIYTFDGQLPDTNAGRILVSANS
jgi:HK97 family phage major capsid protein